MLELSKPTEETHFKALKNSHKGYQAMETTQVPPPLFPATLASFVLVFQTDEAWIKGEEPSFAKLNMQPLLDKMRSADMIVRQEEWGTDEDPEKRPCFALVSISEKRQKQVAEIMGEEDLIRLRMKAEDDEEDVVKGGGAWYPFKQHLAHLYEKSSEGTLFSSCQQCQIMEYMLNDGSEKAFGPQLMQKEACEPGNTPLQQLVKDERIIGYFYLHHEHKKEWLTQAWANTYVLRQPIEDIREYFGEEIGLYFAWCGYLLKMLWVPAFVGIFVYICQFIAFGESGSVDNPFIPLYSIFMCLWCIYLKAGWEQLELTLQYEWGINEWEPEESDRTEFVQNPKTYKRLNPINQSEEYYPDPLWRYISLLAGLVVVMLLIVLNIFAILSIEAGKAQLADLLGVGHGSGMSFLPKILGALVQGGLILVSRWAADIIFRYLNDFENWKTEEEYGNAFIAKRFCFGFINSYFAIYFVALMANGIKVFGVDVSCSERKCIDYAELVCAVVFLQNVIFRYFLAVVWPKIEAWRNSAEIEKHADEEEEKITDLQRTVEGQHILHEFEDLDELYTEKIIELGYVMLFGAVFPLIALIALISNLFDLRGHAHSILTTCKRPMYKCAKDIGTWKTILDIFSIMSILTHCCFFAFTSNSLYYYFPNMTELDRAFYAVACEHILLFIKAMWGGECEDPPDSVQEAFEKRQYELEKLLTEHDNFNPEEEVLFYTSDDGNVNIGGGRNSKGKDKQT